MEQAEKDYEAKGGLMRLIEYICQAAEEFALEYN